MNLYKYGIVNIFPNICQQICCYFHTNGYQAIARQRGGQEQNMRPLQIMSLVPHPLWRNLVSWLESAELDP